MIKQSLVNGDGILEKKFKILRTSIMLGNFKNREDIMTEYEETARAIDKIRKGVYEELLASKMYTTTTLEEERERLIDLISFIEQRVRDRNDFIDDYIKITSNFLDNLDKVSLENELSDYKLRYDNIDEYLKNVAEIEKINIKLGELKEELEEKYDDKANNEIINSKLEDELIEEFNKVISRNDYYAGLNYTDIDLELSKIESSLNDKKDVMDTFSSSYQALSGVGISGAEREEYLSYVQESRNEYYNEIEKKFILEIYKSVLDKENDYDKLYEKRAHIEEILKEREKCRIDLDIKTRDDLEYFADLCNEHFSIIKSQKINIDNIDKIILEISNCEDKLKELEEANNSSAILALLEEYSIDRPVTSKVEIPIEDTSLDKEDVTEVEDKFSSIGSKDNSKKPDNMVVKISDPVKINVKNASDTAKLVMKKVVIVLEPKKFNSKRDKLKEAEDELKGNKNIEVVSENKSVNNDNSIGVELDVNSVFDSSSDKTTDNISINVNSDEFATIPTEIFIDKPKEKKVELFKETDPFLDDNQFELSEDDDTFDSSMLENMPRIKNIGTVKPNNMLSKIADVQKDNDDIILPTLGLSDTENVDVPIVSENYIN